MLESGENYLETILVLHKRTGFVRSVDVAAELGYSKPSISRAMSILEKNGYIVFGHGGGITLTPAGKGLAEAIYERHRCIAAFLTGALGVPEQIADADACRIEHVISEMTFLRIKQWTSQMASDTAVEKTKDA